jgi:cytochrome c oxidase subunit 2
MLVPMLALAACTAPMSIFEPAGDGASKIAWVTWFVTAVATVVFIIVVVSLWTVTRRGRRDRNIPTDPHGFPSPNVAPHSDTPVLIAGALLPAIILGVVYGVGLSAMHPPHTDAIHAPQHVPLLRVTGHQWWWDVMYRDDSMPVFETANEVHVPVGVPVSIQLLSADVIHSFWVPRLQGKVDLIPGDTNEIQIVARQSGTYRGKCAEFCGDEHARMAVTVVAEPMDKFRTWLRAQAAEAALPSDSLARMGEQLVTTGPCALCHTIRGTGAHGDIAPDLTHIGSRLTLGAGVIPNTLGTMEGWISNAPAIKPGTRMPAMTQFSPVQLHAIATYLETLR